MRQGNKPRDKLTDLTEFHYLSPCFKTSNNRDAPDTDFAGYPPNIKAGYRMYMTILFAYKKKCIQINASFHFPLEDFYFSTLIDCTLSFSINRNSRKFFVLFNKQLLYWQAQRPVCFQYHAAILVWLIEQ